MEALSAMNFPIHTAVILCHKCANAMALFSLNSIVTLIFFYLMSSLTKLSLVPRVCGLSVVFSVTDV